LCSSLGVLSSKDDGFFPEHAKMHHSLSFLPSVNALAPD
jgi:hypothetical protein